MVVGICRVVLALPGNASLKGKRAVVRRIVDRVRHRFNAAIAEVDALDVHQRAVLGFAVVSNEASHVHSMADTIHAFIAGATEAVVMDRSLEVIHAGGSAESFDRRLADIDEDDAENGDAEL